MDVARQLFAKNGVANTTMNDIALASGKGRRTLYTYFSSKEAVFYAVIESELERLSDKLDEVANKKIAPQDKIIELIYTHLSMIRETVVRNGNLRAEFFRNIWMVEKMRKNFDEDEIELFRRVYSEGKEDGEFDIENVQLVADITHYCIKGLEVPFIYGRLGHGLTEESSKPLVAKVVYGALGKLSPKKGVSRNSQLNINININTFNYGNINRKNSPHHRCCTRNRKGYRHAIRSGRCQHRIH